MVDRPMETLGCPEWRFIIAPRGGGAPRVEIPFASVSFDRGLNATTSCRVGLPASGPLRSQCCDILNGLPGLVLDNAMSSTPGADAWSHEIHLYADSYLAWAGPLLDMEFDAEKVELTGRDLTAWWDRRYLHNRDRYIHDDLASIFTSYHNDAMEEDPSPNLTIHASDTGITATREVTAKDWANAGDEIRELLRTGLDITAIGRDVLAGGIEILLPDVLPIWDPVVRLSSYRRLGRLLATRYGLTGELRDERVSVSVGGVDSVYGLVEAHETELSIKDDVSAQAAVDGRHDLLRTPPVFITTTLTPDGPGLRHLIPGSQCDVRLSGNELGCREVVDMMRLQSVKVTINAPNETEVGLEIAPLGRTTE